MKNALGNSGSREDAGDHWELGELNGDFFYTECHVGDGCMRKGCEKVTQRWGARAIRWFESHLTAIHSPIFWLPPLFPGGG